MRTFSISPLIRPLLWAVLPLLLLGSCKDKEAEKAKKELAELVEKYKIEDEATIKAYLQTNNIPAASYERRDSGLYIIWLNRGTTGEMPKDRAQVRVRYIGRFLKSDERFDASIDNGTACGCNTFIVGQVVPAWTEVLQLMRVNDRVVILVPSHLGYGAAGNPPQIGAFTPLKFEMELKSFVNP